MKYTLQDRLLKRELGNTDRYSKVRGVYADRQFVNDLDIVNELNGHNGCVNALSWSRSGSLLASGSDDKTVNIYSYLPDNSTKQFDLSTTILTGHSRNIFSVKFMPHSNDRTIITAAGDREVRVFDIERASFSGGHQNLSPASCNARVFRSHSGAVKRIVTEASPFYFMTCSEDGDVRQWDIRQPESTYPRSYGRASSDQVPPPLISYQKYNIDLYTISCSPSQPHYIALGGSHLHCFLHDRRMLGRDKLSERGGLLTPPTAGDDGALEAATRCVRKFAPHGQPRMSRNESKSITACKISDANPNELIASWNGDFIYSFNILQDEESSRPKPHAAFSEGTGEGRVKQQKDRKRKRSRLGSRGVSQEGETRAGSHQRTASNDSGSPRGHQELSLLFRLDNGENVEIPIPTNALTDSRRERSHTGGFGNGVATEVKNLRRSIFDPARRERYDPSSTSISGNEAAQTRQRMEQALVTALKVLEKIDGIMHNWSYPVTESSGAIAFQQKLRDDRGKTWRFVQACGTIARVASRRSSDAGPRRLLDFFDIIRPSPREASLQLERHEHFGYDFIKTVLLWLDSGVGAVLREFTCDPDDPSRSNSRRRPIPKDSGLHAIEEILIPYLKGLAGGFAVDDMDAPGSNRHIFASEKEAVNLLARAMSIEFADLAGRAAETTGEGRVVTQDRETAIMFWGHRVCRSILKNTAIDVTFALVDTAFGEYTARPEAILEGRLDDDDSNAGEEEELELDDDDEDDDEYSSEGSEAESSDDDEEGTSFLLSGPQPKPSAGKNVPSATHKRFYRGHCNVETTKDVNFFGLQDEYVVSGSDCGNLFIWDKKSMQLLNILEGDNEVVNVVQGHPYEPMLAVSGIDHTVKIFSPDARARKDAARGVGIEQSDHSTFSSIGLRGNRSLVRDDPTPPPAHDSSSDCDHAAPSASSSTDEVPSPEPGPNSSRRRAAGPQTRIRDNRGNPLASRKRMVDEYQIVSLNDMERRRGGRDQGTFVSRGMMALLAQRFRAEMNEEGYDVDVPEAFAGEDGEGCVQM